MKKDIEKAKLSLENKIRILQSGGHITKLTTDVRESKIIKSPIGDFFVIVLLSCL